MCTCPCPPPSLLFWTYTGSSRVQHQPTAIRSVTNIIVLPRVLLPGRLLFPVPPETARSVTHFPRSEGEGDTPSADVNPVTLWMGCREELGSRSPSPFSASTPNPQSTHNPSVETWFQSPSCAARTKEPSKPRSPPPAAPSTAGQATGPADNQALHSPMCFVTLIFKDTLA